MLIKIENLTLAYNQHKILENFSLALPNCGLFFLAGPSGSGKTTLLKILAGQRVDKQLSQKGQIKINQAAKGKIDMMFQEHRFIARLNVMENIRIGSVERKDKEIMDLAKLFEIEDLLDKEPSQLSEGEKARISLIRCLIGAGRVVLLDEPFANLNHDLMKKILNYLKSKANERLIIICSHIYSAQEEGVIVLNSNSRYCFKSNDSNLKEKKTSRNRFNHIKTIAINNQKKNFRLLFMLSVFNTLGLIFILIGVITGRGIAKSLEGVLGEGYHYGLLENTKKTEISRQQDEMLAQIVNDATRIDLEELEISLALYQKSTNTFIPLSSSLLDLRAIRPDFTPLNGVYLMIDEGYGEVSISSLEIVIDNKLYPLSIPIRIVYHPYGQNYLAGLDLKIIRDFIAFYRPDIKAERISLFSSNLLIKEKIGQLSEIDLQVRPYLYFNQYYYQLESSLHYFTTKNVSFLDSNILALPLRDYFQLYPDGIYLVNKNNEEIKLVISELNPGTIKASANLLSPGFTDLTLNLKEKDFFSGEDQMLVKKYQVIEVLDVATKTIHLSKEDFLNLPSQKDKSPIAVIAFKKEALKLIKELVKEDYEFLSLIIEADKVLQELASFLTKGMLIFSIIFFFEGTLVTMLLGVYLMLKGKRDFNLLAKLHYRNGEIGFLYFADFLVIAIISFINSAVILGLFSIQNNPAGAELISLSIADININLDFSQLLVINQAHYLLLFLLSFIIPLFSCLINGIFQILRKEN